MKIRISVLCFVAAICALPIAAQNIPAGDDLWSTVGGGSSYVTLTDADWAAICGVHPGNVTVNLTGQALSPPGRTVHWIAIESAMATGFFPLAR